MTETQYYFYLALYGMGCVMAGGNASAGNDGTLVVNVLVIGYILWLLIFKRDPVVQKPPSA
jgi:hypothetical protein